MQDNAFFKVETIIGHSQVGPILFLEFCIFEDASWN